jgi:phosphatidylglycerophosphatase A
LANSTEKAGPSDSDRQPGRSVFSRIPISEIPISEIPFSVWIATAGGAGFAPLAPGTFGSVVGVLLFFPLARLGLPLYSLTLIALCFLGIWASESAERFFQRSDDGRIVIDEVAGQLVTLLPLVVLQQLPLGVLELSGSAAVGSQSGFSEIGVLSVLVVTGFVVFRVFDIWKPGAIRWAEQNFKGGMGVMADDLVAGAVGAVVLTLPAYAVLVQRLSELVRAGGSG